jgi:hypothetical protein
MQNYQCRVCLTVTVVTFTKNYLETVEESRRYGFLLGKSFIVVHKEINVDSS